MKSKEIGSARPLKNSKRVSTTEASSPKEKSTITAKQIDNLTPLHIHIPKSKIKAKKQNKPSKQEVPLQERITKRNYKKKQSDGFNNTDQAIEIKQFKKQSCQIDPHKTRIEQKTKRNPKTTTSKQLSKQSLLKTLHQKNTSTSAEDSSLKKQHSSKLISSSSFQQQYLFIGNQFYLVNNYCPTKRLLNTFRQACIHQNTISKFIAQDKTQKKIKIKIEAKKNIFQAAREEIQNKNKNSKAIVIQSWWRKILHKKKLQTVKYNPQTFKCSCKSKKGISFNFIPENIPSILPTTKTNPTGNVSFQMSQSFDNSKQTINERVITQAHCSLLQTNIPKKIEFHNQDISNKLLQPYVLPQDSPNNGENDDIFNVSPKFHIQKANNLNQSDDSCYISPIKSQQSFDQIHQSEQIQCITHETQQSDLPLIKQLQHAVKIKEMIDLRIAVQKGQIKPPQTNFNKLAINTTILGIHNFLVRFFNFYIQRYREQFINFINMPYGHSITTRIRQLHGKPLANELQQDDQGIIYGLNQVIDDDKYEEFYQWLEVKESKNGNTFVKANQELQRIHNKAILDLFNFQLNSYRPYQSINGVPYPWNISHKALTFYFVTEENISEIFQKIQLRMLKNSSLLCGIILPQNDQKQSFQKPQKCFNIIQFMEDYQQKTHRLTAQHNDTRQIKFVNDQIRQQSFEYDSEDITQIMLQISSLIFKQLSQESIEEISLLNDTKTNIY